ncbi:MAG: hypothetical protein NC123_20815, partial [Butyrivibrio sp.]|nr:hypothetical protein [Butyrivibrio sp.]
MPFPNIRDDKYIQAVMVEILRIVSATHGHTLILFTSYWLMERVFYGLKDRIFAYPLFLMGGGRLDVCDKRFPQERQRRIVCKRQ